MLTQIKTTLGIIAIVFAVIIVDYFASLFFVTHGGNPQKGVLFAALFLFIVGSGTTLLCSRFIFRCFQRLEEQKQHLEKINETVLEQSLSSHYAHKRFEAMLNSTPLACRLWDKDFKVFECNDAAVKLFNLENKQEYFDRYFDLSPEYQPDGQHSQEKAVALIQRTFDGERCIVEWMHQLLDGTPLPTEITLVRVDHEDDYAVAGYTRDLREHKRMMQELERRDSLLNAVNCTATLLLTAADESTFEDSLLESMSLVGCCTDVDRVQLWQNKMIDGSLYYVLKYRWLSDVGKEKAGPSIGLPFPYSRHPDWEIKFLRGECINEPFSNLPPASQAILGSYSIKTLVNIPVFLENRLWGFLSFDDCRQERFFTGDEIDILRSAGLMMSSAVNRQLLLAKIREEHDYSSLLLDTMPFGCSLWDRELNIIGCNDEIVRLFGLKTRQEFLERFSELSPERQSDGSLSSEYTKLYLERAFEEGRCVVEWAHQTVDGTPLPVEAILVRVPYGDDFVVAGYLRDLREHQQMMTAIERRDALLNVMNRVAVILLQSETDAFENNLYLCMSMIAKALDVDRVSIWKNHFTDNALYHMKLHEWWSTEALQYSTGQAGTFLPEDVSYDEQAPGWKEILSRVDCVTGPVQSMPPAVQILLKEQHIVSLCVVPVFFQEEFWGIIRYDNYRQEHIYSESEQLILRSGGMLIANAILRNDMTLSLRSSAEQLETALQDAQTANRAKSIFLARMSHEMRTPLNAVIGLCGLTLENGTLDQEIHTNLEKIYNAGVVLLNTVNDILDISKIEAGKYELQPAVYELASLINDAVTQNILRISDKPIEFVLEINENLPTKLYGDELRVKQIINNLLSNAFKYTMEGTVVLSVVCTRDGDDVWLYVSIKDTGIGIRSEDIPNLFSDYTRVDKNANRFMEGTGLGLSLTKQMAEMMDGTIGVESEYGRGSTFTVNLRQKFVSDDVIGPEMVNNLKNFQNTVIGKYDRNSGIIRIKMPYARVLVVDDNLTNLDVTQGMMRPYDLEVDCLTGGQLAVDVVREGNIKYSAIFMDHMMPGMDGIEAVRLIRNLDTEYAQTVPIIALTANAIVDNEKMFLENGFQAFLPKPIEVARLDEILRHWVRDKEQEALLSGMKTAGSVGQYRRSVSDRRSGIDRRKVKMKLPGLNIEKGIKHFNGNEAIYFRVLRSYSSYTRPLLQSIENVDENELLNYAVVVHGIKGSSRGIFADMIGNAAERLENAARSNEIDYIRRQNPIFLDAVWRLVNDIDTMFAEEDIENQKPKKESPDSKILAELFAACENYDMDGVDAAIAKITEYEYESDEGLAAWLQENVEKMNFSEIKERLSGLLPQ